MGVTGVIVVEDDALARREIVARVRATPELDVVAEAGDLAGARRAMEGGLGASLLLLDLHLPDGLAIPLIPLARARSIAVLVLTLFDDDDTLFDAIEAGAGGYVLKSDRRMALGDALLTLRDGGAPISPRMARRLIERFRAPPRPATSGAPDEGRHELTPREWEVIELFSRGATYRDVGVALGVSVNTVREHVRHMYEKLHVASKAEAVTWAMSIPR
jgi:DNA-binding NarL/FixJ family response regulator